MNYGHGFINQEILAAYNRQVVSDPIRLEQVHLEWAPDEIDTGRLHVKIFHPRDAKEPNVTYTFDRRALIDDVRAYRGYYPNQTQYYRSSLYPGWLFRKDMMGKGEPQRYVDAFIGWWSSMNVRKDIDPATIEPVFWRAGHFDPHLLQPNQESSV